MAKTIRNTMLSLSLIYIVLGVIMLIWPQSGPYIACRILGAAGIVYGVIELVRYLRTRNYAVPEGGLFAGLLCMLFGVLLITRVETVVSIFVAALGVLVIADSAAKIIYCMQLKGFGVKPWKVYIIAAFVLLALGVFMLIDPLRSAEIMFTLAAIFLILDGLFNLWMLWQIKRYA